MGLRSLGKETPSQQLGRAPSSQVPVGVRSQWVTRQLADYSTLGGEVTVERRHCVPTEWG